MQPQSCNIYDKYTLNKSRFLIFVIFGIFAFLRYLAQFEHLANFIISAVTLLPFAVVILYMLWIFFKDRTSHEAFVLMSSCHVFLNLLLKLSVAILILFIVFFPTAWKPIWTFLFSLKNFFTLETYFIFSAYASVIIVALGSIIFFIRLYQKSIGTYQNSIRHLLRKILYGTFFLLAFLFTFSVLAYPQAYAPMTAATSDLIAQVMGNQNHADNDSSLFSTLTKAVRDTKNNLFGEISTTNKELASNLTQSKEELAKSINETADSLKEKVSSDGGEIAGDLVLSGSKADLTVEGKTTLRNVSPDADNTYDLGGPDKGWNNAYVHRLFGSSPLIIGDGDTSHGLVSSNDLIVSGNLEINSNAYLDNNLNLNGNIIPSSISSTLGNPSNYFDTVYANSLVGVSLDYLPTTGGTLTGKLTVNSTDDKLLSLKKNGTEKAYVDNDGILSAKGLKLNGKTKTAWVDNDEFDAIVDAGGEGDYTNINDAVDAGKQKLFIKNGNYTLTDDLIMDDPAQSFALVGESTENTIIDTAGYYVNMESETVLSNQGSISIDKGSFALTGDGNQNFITSGIAPGMWIMIGNYYYGHYYKIKSVDSATQLTLESGYLGPNVSSQGSYIISYIYENAKVENITFRNSQENSSPKLGQSSQYVFYWGYEENAGYVSLVIDNCIFDVDGDDPFYDGIGTSWIITNNYFKSSEPYFPGGSRVEGNVFKGGVYLYPRQYFENNIIFDSLRKDSGENSYNGSVLIGNRFIGFVPNFTGWLGSDIGVTALGNKDNEGNTLKDYISAEFANFSATSGSITNNFSVGGDLTSQNFTADRDISSKRFVNSGLITLDSSLDDTAVSTDYQNIIKSTTGLISYWKMDYDLKDDKGGNDGTGEGDLPYRSAKFGSASVDLSNGRITAGGDESNITGAITMESWIKINEFNGNEHFIFSKAYNGWPVWHSYAMKVRDDGKIAIELTSNLNDWEGEWFTSDNSLISVGQWYHVAATWDGSTINPDNVKLYINGSLAQSWTKTTGLASNNWSLYMGGLNGYLDELALYDANLNLPTISAHYAAGQKSKVAIINSGGAKADLQISGDLYNENNTYSFSPSVADSSSAIAYLFNTENNLSTAGAKLLSLQNNDVEKVFVNKDGGAYFAGSLGLGDTTPDTTLKVVGSICAKTDDTDCAGSTAGIVYADNFVASGTQLAVPDYVFDGSNPNYQRKSIEELEAYIAMYKHLPGIPSVEDVHANGLDYSSMLMGLLEKTEENTLYIIENHNQIKDINNTLTLNGINDNVENLETDLENSISKLKKDLKEISAKLDEQIAEMDAKLNADILSNAKDINNIKTVLGIKEDSSDINIQGKLSVEKMETGGITIKVVDTDRPTIGTATIETGEISEIISTKAVNDDSKIYMTPATSTQGQTPYVGEIKSGESFEIKIDEVVDEDMKLNWWLIENKSEAP